MMKNRRLSRKIQESAWSTLSSMIEYKCSWYGETVYQINRWYVVRTWSSCKLEHLNLDVRNWTGSGCGVDHDRDVNASEYIRIQVSRSCIIKYYRKQ